MLKLTQEEVEKRFKEKGWKLIGIYIDSNTNVEAICLYCEKIKLVIPSNIFDGRTQSCGCMISEWSITRQSTAHKEDSLGFLYPEIAKLYSKNNDKSAFEVYPKSTIKRKWICEEYGYEHEYESTSLNIVSGNRCPYCVNQKVLKNFNDLAFKRPDLLIDWDYDKNKIEPNEVTCGSRKRVWWKCNKCGYKWQTNCCARTYNHNGCPKCRVSRGEKRVSDILTKLDIEYEQQKRFDTCKNQRQLPFDFYLPDFNLLIEYQGKQHYEKHYHWEQTSTLEQRQKHDRIKRKFCKKEGIRLLEIKYTDYDNIENILEKLFLGLTLP